MNRRLLERASPFILLALIVLGIVLITAGFFIAHSIASGWVGRMAAQNKGHASSLYLWSYYMGSSILGAGAGWLAGGIRLIVGLASQLFSIMYLIAAPIVPTWMMMPVEVSTQSPAGL